MSEAICECVALFQRRGADGRIIEWNLGALRLLPAADPANYFCGCLGLRMYRDIPFQLVDERPPPVADLERVRPICLDGAKPAVTLALRCPRYPS